MRADRLLDRHPSDGGGRAWFEDSNGPASATVGVPGRWTIIYEAGALGIAIGGMIFLQGSPFWDWSPPQVVRSEAPGFVEVTTDADGVDLERRQLGDDLVGIEVRGRSLVAGERVRIVYGAGRAGAMPDRYAEHDSRFWIAVDGNGDGVRKVVAESPALDVAPGPPARLVVTLPTVARPGESARLTVAVLDGRGNAGVDFDGPVEFVDAPIGLEVPHEIFLKTDDHAHKTIDILAREPGVYRVRATGPGGLSSESNPMVVEETGTRVWWGDLHGHSQLSDGTGTAEDYFAYAREVAALDIAALTDHDHWGMLFLDEHPEMWDEVCAEVARYHAPGRFVTLLGYEWTSWIHGHRHVLYFDDGEVLSSVDPAFESPTQLWGALRGRDALTVAHHSAGGPIATNWEIPPDRDLEPVTEVTSVHGSSEAVDCPGRIYSAFPGNFVRDALDRGYRLGFVGSGDSHDGHPGLAQLGGSGAGGLAAIVTEELTRHGVLEALRARHVYATNGPRLLLRVDLDGAPMGSAVQARTAGPERVLTVRVVGTAPIEEVHLIRKGRVTDRRAGEGRHEVLERFLFARNELAAGEYLYVRVLQSDGGLAWSSPIFLE